MFTQTNPASSHVGQAESLVEQLAVYGIPVPDDLAQALDAARAVDSIRIDVPELEQQINTAAPDQVADMVRAHAEAVATRDTLGASKKLAYPVVARRVIRAHQVAAPGFLEALRPAFLDAATRYTEALRALPHKVKEGPVEGLSGLSPEHLEAWQQFSQARAELDAFKALRDTLGINARSKFEYLTYSTAYGKPTDYAQAFRLTKKPDVEKKRRLGFLHRFVEEGVELWWPSLADQAKLVKFLEADSDNWRSGPNGYERRPEAPKQKHIAWK